MIENTDGGILRIPQSMQSTYGAQGDIGDGRQDFTYGRNATYTPGNGDIKNQDTNSFLSHCQINDDSTFMPDEPSDGVYGEGSGDNNSRTKLPHQQYDKFAKRTILLSNL